MLRNNETASFMPWLGLLDAKRTLENSRQQLRWRNWPVNVKIEARPTIIFARSILAAVHPNHESARSIAHKIDNPGKEVNMAEDRKINHEFDWNRDPSFFLKQPKEDQQITLGPDLSWPLMTQPGPQEFRLRERVEKISGTYEKAA
jgi:hypothetical protein